ncbi:MAG: tRNA (adenosine(37)-N6)-threonylcarbamoyltransferase complex dimerization subunit type 1 TsaB [Inquilinaceae bacterium]
MIVLGIDTAGSACSVTAWRDGAVLASRDRSLSRGHAEVLMPMIEDLMAEAALTPGSIDLYGVTVGPGSFTGLRIGLAAAGGMALATGRPIVGLSRFDVIAASVAPARPAGRALVVALDSRNRDLFVQIFAADGASVGPPACVAPEGLPALVPDGGLILAGDAAPAALDALAGHGSVEVMPGSDRTDTAVLAALAAERRHLAGLEPPAPLYLRSPAAQPAAPARAIVP